MKFVYKAKDIKEKTPSKFKAPPKRHVQIKLKAIQSPIESLQI
jgi:hypothetical protein